LPPPLPLQRPDTSNASTAEEDETTSSSEATTEDSSIPEEEDNVPDSIEEKPPSSTRTLDSNVDYEIAPSQPQPIPQLSVAVHLIDQVRMQQWSALLSQPKWRRRQVKYRDMDGLSPLHWAAAGGAPLPVVDRLLTAANSIAQQADNEGSLPLHFATHYAAPRDVIAALWQAYPAAIFHRDRYGRTPLYHAVDKSLGLATLQLLLQGGDTVDAAAVTVNTTSTAEPTATITDNKSHNHPHYELITTPCYSPQGSSRREQATRTPLFMVWASVLNDREARIKWRGKKWDKAVWMLQNSYRYHHGMVTKTTKATTTGGEENEDEDLSSSLVSICVRMDLYLPDPVVPLVATAQGTTPGRLADLVVAAATPSYSLERILELLGLLLSRLIVDQKEDDGVDIRGVAAMAAAQAGQPWQVLERLPHRDRHALAIIAAMARPILYDRTTKPSLPGGFLQDPLGLLRRLQTPKESASKPPEQQETRIHSTVVARADSVAASAVDTIYRLLRENPGQLLVAAASKTASVSA
jgi:ankyrin repeat protein